METPGVVPHVSAQTTQSHLPEVSTIYTLQDLRPLTFLLPIIKLRTPNQCYFVLLSALRNLASLGL
ncbi:hypothetical protein M413DRAFT_439244 [Hebeloma cylindrosporum]|uniref:Uncharacterized protein n=1 Tax=Hebeloma cylindrosporum TaxID=76867 RepID=A0A0C2Z2R7_HEBCY|nr:hypothetical protein M413DRAFT_439244 [Hebeloma cylindrosporum h7]